MFGKTMRIIQRVKNRFIRDFESTTTVDMTIFLRNVGYALNISSGTINILSVIISLLGNGVAEVVGRYLTLFIGLPTCFIGVSLLLFSTFYLSKFGGGITYWSSDRLDKIVKFIKKIKSWSALFYAIGVLFVIINLIIMSTTVFNISISLPMVMYTSKAIELMYLDFVFFPACVLLAIVTPLHYIFSKFLCF